MDRHCVLCRHSYGSVWEEEKDSIVLEGREELYTVLRALRHSDDPKAIELSKKFLRVHLNLRRCPRCGSLRRDIIGIYCMGWEEVCSYCDAELTEELDRNMKKSEEAKKENKYE